MSMKPSVRRRGRHRPPDAEPAGQTQQLQQPDARGGAACTWTSRAAAARVCWCSPGRGADFAPVRISRRSGRGARRAGGRFGRFDREALQTVDPRVASAAAARHCGGQRSGGGRRRQYRARLRSRDGRALGELRAGILPSLGWFRIRGHLGLAAAGRERACARFDACSARN